MSLRKLACIYDELCPPDESMTKPKLLKLNFKKRLWQHQPLIIILASGILMGLAPAPLNFWVLAWVALLPLWVLAVKFKSSFKALLLQGLVWGIGYHGLALSWITESAGGQV